MPQQNKESWKELVAEIRRRVKDPFGQPEFVLYFVAIILLIGGLGVWISVYKKDWEVVPRDMSTYLLAILAASAADLVLSKKSTRSLQMLGLFVLVTGGFLAVLSQANTNVIRAYVYAIVGTLMALLLWWVANSIRRDIFGPAEPIDALGGQLHEELTGDLTDIET
jgi:hypothetical protein